MSYINFGNKNIDPADHAEVLMNYSSGYVFGRNEHGSMTRVRSLRVDLKVFRESSENRRILKKYIHDAELNYTPYPNYSWEIHKMGKDFYDTKFGEGTFSANKIKELFTSPKGNFNSILSFRNPATRVVDGYCILHLSESEKGKIVHYAYPFYRLDLVNTSFGMFMMTRSVQYFKEIGFDYIYLGSVHEPSSLYKLQFSGLEWWDEEIKTWDTDIQKLKDIIRNS
jgi:arginyl-tRNA--protein-N-Asp/Glu arginylyltransferase